MSGGGFLASQSNDSPGSGGKSRNTTLRPVVISQLLRADQDHPDADFRVDGQDVSQVVFIGRILHVNPGSTNVAYSIEDGTGTIDVRQWLETADDDTHATDGVEQDKYVRVVGNLKSFNGKRHVGAVSVHPLEDMDGSRDCNQMQYHILDVVHTHLQVKRGALPSEDGAGRGAGPGPRNAAAGDPYSQGGGANGGHANNTYADLPPVQRKIMQYFDRIGGADQFPQEGVDVAAIFRSLGGNEGAIRDQILNLIEDGYLYSTIDEDHVLPTSS